MDSSTTESPKKKDLTLGDNEQWLHMYQQMCKIRAFEENANELYLSAKMPGLTHLYIGEEAIAVGVCETLRQDDYITSTHRGHGHCLAKGAAVDRMFAELLGKEAGYCRVKGGSMHIADQERGNLGANAIVGGRAPEYIRDDPDLIRITRDFFAKNKPIASVCHGVEIPARAGCVRGRRVATVLKCKFDLEVCGGIFVNEPCVVDGNLVSGRTYHDNGKYLRPWLEMLKRVREEVVQEI